MISGQVIFYLLKSYAYTIIAIHCVSVTDVGCISSIYLCIIIVNFVIIIIIIIFYFSLCMSDLS